MSRWIEADVIRAKLMEYIGLTNGFDRAFDEAPSIDIVRCKECKHCHYEQNDDIYHCYKLFHRFYNADNHYCSYGEREGE